MGRNIYLSIKSNIFITPIFNGGISSLIYGFYYWIMIKNLLVPGGLGFIGSHTVIELFTNTEVKMIIVDDMSNCFDDVFDRIKQILIM